jgi:hypothetical protein
MCKKIRGEAEVTCLHVEFCKYKNVGRPLCKKIEVKLWWQP